MNDEDIQSRLGRAREEMARQNAGLLLVGPSADFRYLTGIPAHASERPILLVADSGDRTILLISRLEAAGVPDLPGVELVTYGETDDPYAALSGVASEPSTGDCIISDQTWSSILLRLQELWKGSSWGPASRVMRELRMRKTRGEIDIIREAGACADRAFDNLVKLRFSGRTERAIARELRELLHAEGLDEAGWGPIVGSGPNGASPHHVATDREVHEGDPVVLDFGGTLEGYGADMTRTVHVGTPDGEFVRAYDVVRAGQEAGIAAARPGVEAQDVDAATRRVIAQAGLGEQFIHRTGHGLGLEGHEDPYIVEGNRLKLEPGMVFSIEPGVYFTGRWGIRIEDIVAVNESGAERMNNATRELIVVH